MVVKGHAFQIRVELRGLQIRGPGRVIARRLEIKVITTLVGAGGPGVSGMGAANPARPIEVRCPLDGAPTTETGFEIELVLEGVGGEGEAEGEEKDGR
nr:MAG: hypothetical protein BECKLPF1236C_GA0070990_105752 [Candidatus Kentron sp. LPFa]